ncbi:MAG: sulfite exporter TauE/SafE family protein [Bifidobacteriaceae bacterium]|jgi:sulfite exporter TauE/SafE/copper chaperone CopZ|nr:sulfite exporter TauE/SafE family protein [Bifidobacteriaceae bacterium]
MKQQVKIVGMHCKACEKLIKDELVEIAGVKNVRVSLGSRTAVFESSKTIPANVISQAIRRAGYRVGNEKLPWLSKDKRDYVILLAGILLSLGLFWVFSQVGWTFDLVANSENTILYALLMGLTAGFSTCMALIGGLVAGMSARHSQQHPDATELQNFRPHLFFNLGRIAGFAGLGAVLGALGSIFTFSPMVQGILTILAAVFMLVIGLQLTGLFPRLTAFSLPPQIAEKLGLDRQRKREYSHLGSIVLGVLTFFLPCGFTQSMQLFTVSTGSPMTGALVMGLFAVGTTPGLLLVGAVTSIMKGKAGKIALKFVGVLVVAFALSSFSSGLSVAGVRIPNLNPFAVTLPVSDSTVSLEIPAENVYEVTYIDATQQLSPDELVLQRGQNYRITINPLADGVGCMSTIMLPGLTDQPLQLIEQGKPISFEFLANNSGEFKFVCAMGIPFNMNIRVEG